MPADDPDGDQELRRRLGGLDPAAARPPLGEEEIRSVTERVLDLRPEPRPGPRPRGRVVAAGLAAALVVVAVVAVVAVAVGVSGRGLPGSATPGPAPLAAPVTTGGDAVVLRLVLPARSGRAEASCVAARPSYLTGVDVAFGGVVTSVVDGVARLRVTTAYRGVGAGDVLVPQPPGGLSEASPEPFVTGRAYLVSADAGTVLACGFTGPATAERQAFYRQAFDG